MMKKEQRVKYVWTLKTLVRGASLRVREHRMETSGSV